jgi:hypothetical protein
MGNPNSFYFYADDTAWIDLRNDGGNLIADAIKLVPVPPTQGNPLIIDNMDAGFANNNWYERGFLDMQDEDTLYHNSISKVPFFVSSGCQTGDYMACYKYDSVYENLTSAISNDLGLLYGMAHSGLMSFTSAISYPKGEDFRNFTMTLAGKDSRGQPNTFGDAMLTKCNSLIDVPMVLIGAGTLRADSTAYVPYGTQEVTIENQQISNTVTYSDAGELVWLQNFNVTSTGNCTVIGKEVRIYAESDLQGTVDIKAQ